MKERLGRVEHMAFGAAELTRRRGLDPGPHRLAGQLHPVADPQDRQAQLEDRRVAMRSARLVDARRAAREDRAPAGSARARARAVMSWRTIRAKACRSRTRRAMSWTYCAPKSRTRTGRAAGSESVMSWFLVSTNKHRGFVAVYLLFRAPSLSDEAVTANSTNELRCWSNYCSRSTTSAVKSGSGSRLRNMVARALTPERGSLEPSSEKSEVRRQERLPRSATLATVVISHRLLSG